MSESKSFFEGKVKGGSAVVFAQASDAAVWLKKEVEFWAWAKGQKPTLIGYQDDGRNRLVHSIAQAREQAQSTTPEAYERFKASIASYLESGLVSSTPRAKFIEKLRQDRGDVAAATALAMASGSARLPDDQFNNVQHRIARFVAEAQLVGFEAGVSTKAVEAARSSLSMIAGEYGTQLAKQTEANQATLTALQTQLATARKEHDAALAKHTETMDTIGTNVNQQVHHAVTTITETEERFRKHMKLEAPVHYWETKGKGHLVMARVWLGLLGLFAVGGSVGLFFVFDWVYHEAARVAATAGDKSSAALIVLSAGAAVATTITFWIARFMSRMFLSERHLSIDAKLRSTLALTYLAMSDKEKVGESDRAIVLPALFRAGADGIVQEDNNLDGLLAMAAKYLERGAK